MNYHYSILIQWSDEDQKYVVSFPELGSYSGFRSYEVHLKPPPRLWGGGWGWGSCTS
ncbi:hypothetical protein PN451_08975 [Dolichospermum planctonicum CS-1226]|uniref:Uncharacterized protein n=1 Tax=Dolichospermum planctonicum CS-1226 TaxID=3021751 RepID=A0ABT5AF89_9CYAN|nr:hypothetical protein [Dolichospermum planctonicum]MDB9535966.1 hypothetical protein [Dolichospermum planctonicum CS-1226]